MNTKLRKRLVIKKSIKVVEEESIYKYLSKMALLGLVGKMYSKIHSQERGGGTKHKDTKDTKTDQSYCKLNLSHRT